MMKKESKETIEKLWTTYHATRHNLYASIPTGIYQKLKERGHNYPQFVLPLPRKDGYEFYFLQFIEDYISMTSLLEYKIHKEYSRAHLMMYHHRELVSSHGLVLMQGILSNGTCLSTQEAQLLAFMLQYYYLQSDEGFEKVKLFHRYPEQFDVQSLMEDLEKIL
jgi:ATP synthase F1 complex assembly factor 1